MAIRTIFVVLTICFILMLACDRSPSGATTVRTGGSGDAVDVEALAATEIVPQVWGGHIKQWGGMREVLALGKTEARVVLGDVVQQPHAYGIGAVAELMGEVTILNGKAFVAQVDGEFVTSTVEPERAATLLAVAYVPKWNTVAIEKPLGGDALMVFIQDQAKQIGIDAEQPFPFLVEGRLSVAAHIINGSCPRAGGEEPIRFACDDREGTIVGVYAKHAAGTLTHHGEVSHMHVVFENQVPQSGHADDVRVFAGASLRLPG